MKSDNWTAGALLFGGYVTVPLNVSGKFNFDARLMMGYGSGTAPELTVSDANTSVSVTQKSISGNAMALDLSLGLRYLVAPKISLLFNMDIFGTDPEFRNGELKDNLGNTYPVDDFDQPINSVNFTLGVGFMLR